MPILNEADAQLRIERTRKMTGNQASYIRDLLVARVAADDEEQLAYWRRRWENINGHRQISAMIEDLQKLPTLAAREAEARRTAEYAARQGAATEEGFYRNPATGELWRITKQNWSLILWKYSETGGPRRLAGDGTKIVKGRFVKRTGFQSRLALTKGEVQAAWKIDAQTLATEYAYGFCPLHNGPLTDGVSVTLGYGKKCAEREGLPWGEEYAKAKLAELQAAQ